MKHLKFETGSFRDPAGKIFYSNGRIFRKLSNIGIKRYEFIKKNDLLEDLIKKKIFNKYL